MDIMSEGMLPSYLPLSTGGGRSRTEEEHGIQRTSISTPQSIDMVISQCSFPPNHRT